MQITKPLSLVLESMISTTLVILRGKLVSISGVKEVENYSDCGNASHLRKESQGVWLSEKHCITAGVLGKPNRDSVTKI